MAVQPAVAHHASAHHGEELGFWRKYVFSTDHKTIGIQYAVTGLLFLLFGFSLMMLMRWQLAYPGRALPFLGWLLGDKRMPGGVSGVRDGRRGGHGYSLASATAPVSRT